MGGRDEAVRALSSCQHKEDDDEGGMLLSDRGAHKTALRSDLYLI